MIWNIRGIGKIDKQKILFDMLLTHRPHILVLLECFIHVEDASSIHRFGFHSVFSNISNKIWCLAQAGFDVQVVQNTNQLLHVKICSILLQKDIFCTFVYAKCYRNPRRALWEKL